MDEWEMRYVDMLAGDEASPDPFGAPYQPYLARGGRDPGATLADDVGAVVSDFLRSPVGPFLLGVGAGYLLARVLR